MKNSVLKKVFDVIGTLFVSVAVVAVVMLVLSMILPRFGYGIAIIKSGSMESALGVGSVAVIGAQDAYANGDIITFTRVGQDIVTHRIVEVSGEGSDVRYSVKGDANEEQDALMVEQEHVMGKVLFGIPWLGHIALFVRTPLGLTILIGIPAAWIIFEQIQNIKGEVKKRKESDRL